MPFFTIFTASSFFFFLSASRSNFAEKNKEVVVVDNFITGSRDNLKQVINDIELIEGDIRDLELMKDLCGKCDYVLHQAALRSVPRSVDDP